MKLKNDWKIKEKRLTFLTRLFHDCVCYLLCSLLLVVVVQRLDGGLHFGGLPSAVSPARRLSF